MTPRALSPDALTLGDSPRVGLLWLIPDLLQATYLECAGSAELLDTQE